MQFEIHVNRGGRWAIESAESNQNDAVAAAKRRIGAPGVEGIRVVVEETSRLGRVSQKVVFEQQGRIADTGVIAIGTIDAAPGRCEKPKDLFGGDARQTMAKLFRNYTSKMNLTVSEILYNGRELKRVMEKDNLLSSAVSKVASLQAGAGDLTGAKNRRDELFTMIDEVVAKANAVDKTDLPSIAAVGLTALEEAVASKANDADERDYLIRVAISRDLMNERSFLGKLENAIKWVDGTDPTAAVDALDDFIADTLTDPTVIQDVLGRRDNLLAAILALLDLLDGKFEITNKTDGSDPLGERLNKLIGAARLPSAAAVIADRLQSMLAGRNPLVRDAAPEEEKDALKKLVDRLVPVDGTVTASPVILNALIERGARVVNKGGDTGRSEAVAMFMALIPEPARKLQFAFAAHRATPYPAVQAAIPGLIEMWCGETTTATAFHAQSTNPALVMRAVTKLFYAVRDGDMPEDIKRTVTQHLERLLFEYIEKAQILRMVDDPNRPLRARARLLMSMCLPDMLPPGKVVEAARVRVVNYLRQPDFTTQVVADLTDPKEKDTALRELFDLMSRAGFR